MTDEKSMEKAIRERAHEHAIGMMTMGEAYDQAADLMVDYFRDVSQGVNFSEYDEQDRELRLDRLADVITRLERGFGR